MRREIPEYLANAVGAAPPIATDDIAAYRADLDMGLRYLLYGDVYRSHRNDGELPDAAKIQDNARNQLLRQYVVANSALDDGDLVPARASDGNVEIDAAVDLMGGKESSRSSRSNWWSTRCARPLRTWAPPSIPFRSTPPRS
jgi:hypothetical protein